MSYKKIVAGVATFAVAASLVAPSAFAYTTKEYVDWSKTNIDSEYVTLLETAAQAGAALDSANATLKAAEIKLAAAQRAEAAAEKAADKAADAKAAAKGDEVTAATEADTKAKQALTEAQGAVKTAQGEVDKAKEAQKAAQKAFDAAEEAASKAVVAAKVAVEVAPADKAANKHVEESLEAADALEVQIRSIDLTSLAKTYEQEVRDIKLALGKLQTAVKALDGYKKMAPNTKEAKARDLDKVIADLKAALSKIKDADLKAATKQDAASAKKHGKKLPKTGQQTPVAPFAAAGAAALIAAGLVASRKVNA